MQSELGANAILAVSIAACKAGAAEKEVWILHNIFSYPIYFMPTLVRRSWLKLYIRSLCASTFLILVAEQTWCYLYLRSLFWVVGSMLRILLPFRYSTLSSLLTFLFLKVLQEIFWFSSNFIYICNDCCVFIYYL